VAPENKTTTMYSYRFGGKTRLTLFGYYPTQNYFIATFSRLAELDVSPVINKYNSKSILMKSPKLRNKKSLRKK